MPSKFVLRDRRRPSKQNFTARLVILGQLQLLNAEDVLQARCKAGYLRSRKRGCPKAVTRSLLALEYREHRNDLTLQLVVSNIPALSRQTKDWGQSGAGGGPSPAAEQARMRSNWCVLSPCIPAFPPFTKLSLGSSHDAVLLTLLGWKVSQKNVSPALRRHRVSKLTKLHLLPSFCP